MRPFRRSRVLAVVLLAGLAGCSAVVGPADLPAPAAPTAGSCAAPLQGQLAGPGLRIRLTLQLTGPAGAQQLSAILDTGGVQSTFDQSVLQGLGFQPEPDSGTVVSGATGGGVQAQTYAVPAGALRVLDGTAWVALLGQALPVLGAAGWGTALLGPDVLAGGARLQTAGAGWLLFPACA